MAWPLDDGPLGVDDPRGIVFGVAAVRAGVVPRWTGVALIAGVLLIAVAAALLAASQTVAAGVRDLAFAAMGASLLRQSV